MSSKQSNRIPLEHIPFVQSALRRRLEWPGRIHVSQVINELAKNGVADVTLYGSAEGSAAALPFYLNLQARVPADVGQEMLKRCFSASVKFGGAHGQLRRGRVCVVKIDGSHGGWHLHPFDPELGIHAPATSDQIHWMPDLVLGHLSDAVQFAIELFCSGGLNYEQAPGFSWLSTFPDKGTTVSLLVP